MSGQLGNFNRLRASYAATTVATMGDKGKETHPNSTRKLIVLKGTSNFHTWRIEREAHARAKGYWPLLAAVPYVFEAPPPIQEQVIPPPRVIQEADGVERIIQDPPVILEKPDVQEARHRRKTEREEAMLDGKGMLYLLQAVSPTISVAIGRYTHTMDMWNYLFNTYGQVNPTAIDNLLAQFTNLRVQPLSVPNVFAKVSELVVKLAQAGHDIDMPTQRRKVLTLLSQSPLPRLVNYIDHIHSEIQREPDLDMDQIENRLVDKEQSLIWELEQQSLPNPLLRPQASEKKKVSHQPEALALQATVQTGRNGRRSQATGTTAVNKAPAEKGKVKPQKAKGVCFNCDQPGHLYRQCPEPRRAPALLAAAPHGNKARVVRLAEPDSEEESDDTEVVLLAMPQVTRARHGDNGPYWIHDSGATSHVTPERADFLKLQKLKKPTVVSGLNNQPVVATHRGTVRLQVWREGQALEFIDITDVLYVPGLDYRLFSAKAAVRDGLHTSITDEEFAVVTKVATNFLFTCEARPEVGGLYACPFTSCDASVPPYAANWTPHGAIKKETGLLGEESEVESTHPWDRFPKPRQTYAIWHSRLGHLSKGRLLQMAKQQMVEGMEIIGPLEEECLPCIDGKAKTAPYPTVTRTRATAPWELLHADICQYPVRSYNGKKYALTVMDDYSGYTVVHAMAKKSDAEQAITKLLTLLERQFPQHLTKTLRCDDGGEFRGQPFREMLAQKGIELQLAAPYRHGQNGVVERRHQTLLASTRAMLIEAKLPKRYWPLALEHACYVLNRVPYSPCVPGVMTPYQAVNGKVPNISHLRRFGCYGHAVEPEELRTDKLAPRTFVGQMVGYAHGSKAYKLLRDNGSIINRADVLFRESAEVEPLVDPFVDDHPPLEELPDDDSIDYAAASDQPMHRASQRDPSLAASASAMPVGAGSVHKTQYTPTATRRGTVYSTKEHAGGGKMHRNRLEELVHIARDVGGVVTKEEVKIPNTYKQAMESEYAAEWEKAMEREIESLRKYGVYEVVARPHDKKVIKTRWVNAVKTDAAGVVTDFKSRTVAKGFVQVQGDDYEETFAPTSIPSTVRTILAHAAVTKRVLIQCDVKTAYLNAEIDEEIYIEPSEGFEDPEGKVWRLKKCLYGLKQSARVWNQTLTAALKTIGFIQATSDPCLYTRPSRKGQPEGGYPRMELAPKPAVWGLANIDILTVHVDDIRGSSTNQETANKLLKDIQGLFDVKVNKPEDSFLGIQTEVSGDGIFLHQTTYANRVLARFDMSNCAAVDTPITGDKLSLTQCPQTTEEKDQMADRKTKYRSIVGSLNYLAVWTRPDLLYAVSQLSRFGENPGEVHYKAAKRVLRYLKGTVGKGLMYSSSVRPRKYQEWADSLEVYVDSDHANNVDNRKSVTGIVVMVWGMPIYWYSRQQPIVAVSSTEAEYVSACQATKEALWARKILRDFGAEVKAATVLWEDNQACIRLTENPEAFARTKHIDVRFHMVRHHVEAGDVVCQYVQTSDQAADFLTKPTTGPQLARFLNFLGVVERGG